jgi:hypothetical protein
MAAASISAAPAKPSRQSSSEDDSGDEVVLLKRQGVVADAAATAPPEHPVPAAHAAPAAAQPLSAKMPKTVKIPSHLPEGDDARHKLFEQWFSIVEIMAPSDALRIEIFLQQIALACTDLTQFRALRTAESWPDLKLALRKRFITMDYYSETAIRKKMFELKPSPGRYKDYWFALENLASIPVSPISPSDTISIALGTIKETNFELWREVRNNPTAERMVEALAVEDSRPRATAIVPPTAAVAAVAPPEPRVKQQYQQRYPQQQYPQQQYQQRYPQQQYQQQQYQQQQYAYGPKCNRCLGYGHNPWQCGTPAPPNERQDIDRSWASKPSQRAATSVPAVATANVAAASTSAAATQVLEPKKG